jgi:hypothetical protein
MGVNPTDSSGRFFVGQQTAMCRFLSNLNVVSILEQGIIRMSS